MFPQSVKLTWDPTQETNVSHYNIYRSIHDKLHFHFIGTADFPYLAYTDNKIHIETQYYYAATVVLHDGTETVFSNHADVYIGVKENSDIEFEINQIYPNPFNPSTNISFSLAKPKFVTAKVYDIRGQEILTLLEGHMIAGLHKLVFDGKNLMNGVYFVSFNAGGFVKTRRMILLK